MAAVAAAAAAPPGLGMLGALPPELRVKVFAQVLVATNLSDEPPTRTWGWGSRISVSLLSVSKQMYAETVNFLYETPHTLYNEPDDPPTDAIARMHRITHEITFRTQNRGDCEESIERPHLHFFLCDKIGLSLRLNKDLKELNIVFLNETQRKRGPKRIRSREVQSAMQRMLLPFATLSADIPIEITGFDTLDIAEMFEEMRSAHAGSTLPIRMLMNDLDKRGSLRQSSSLDAS